MTDVGGGWRCSSLGLVMASAGSRKALGTGEVCPQPGVDFGQARMGEGRPEGPPSLFGTSIQRWTLGFVIS